VAVAQLVRAAARNYEYGRTIGDLGGDRKYLEAVGCLLTSKNGV